MSNEESVRYVSKLILLLGKGFPRLFIFSQWLTALGGKVI